MSKEIVSEQLLGNVMSELERRGFDILEFNNHLDEVTRCLQEAILVSRPDTVMSFIEADSEGDIFKMKLSDIKIGEDGLPLFRAAVKKRPYAGSIHDFLVFGWVTNSGKIYTANLPHISFNLPKSN